MRVYVETNFVLELALEQAQHGSCEQILLLAEAKKIEVVIPAYSLVEPHETLVRRHRDREDLKEKLDRQLVQMRRSARHAKRLEQFRRVTDLLVDTANEETRRLERLRLRIVGACTVLPLDHEGLVDAVGYRMAAFDVSPQDSIIFTAVISHLDRSADDESCFLNRDRDFGDPKLVEELRRRHCTLIPSFEHGLERVRSRLGSIEE